MIHINLLDYRSLYNKIKIKKQFVIAICTIMVTVFFLLGVTAVKNKKIRELSNNVTTKQNELNILKAQVSKVKEFEEKEVGLKEMLSVIRLLKRNQTSTALILDDLNKQLPNEVWLTMINEVNQKISLTGYSFSNPGIATFMKHLELSPYFEQIELIGSEQSTIGKDKVKKFTITCTLNISST